MEFNRGDKVQFETDDTYFIGTVCLTRDYGRVQVRLDAEYITGAWNTAECDPDCLTLLN